MKQTRSDNYKISICIDFFDDLINGPFTHDSLKALFEKFKALSIERIYWIYTLKFSEGLHQFFPYKGLMANAEQTFKNIGDFLPAALKIAHQLGLSFYAVYKPLDLGHEVIFPFGTPQAEKYGKMDAVGGRVSQVASSLVELSQMRLERHPADLVEKTTSPIHRIEIYSNNKKAMEFKSDGIKILVSNDNYNYQPLKTAANFSVIEKENIYILQLDDLNISELYLCLQCGQEEQQSSLENTLDKLIRIFDKDGNEISFTYGLLSFEDKCAGFEKRGLELEEECVRKGYHFNYHGNALRDGYQQNENYSLDNDKGYAALARGKQQFVTGFLSPAYPQVRALWLKHIKECLDAGVDGVDLRVVNHNRNMEWERYGFEEPVREEYLKRTGNNLLDENHDTSVHRQSLCDFYNDFYREASQLIHSQGKKCQAHISSQTMKVSDQERYSNFEWGWKDWIKEDLVDEISLKDILPEDYIKIKGAIGEKTIACYCTPGSQGLPGNSQAIPRLKEYLRSSKAAGHQGLTMYECWNYFRMKNEKTAEVIHSEFTQLLDLYK
ncbi:MAG: hypothetical protein ACYTFY_15715 [Planctomycetota bacterium]|jgi:hypothetical protein